mgnify:CR=1 FL=1
MNLSKIHHIAIIVSDYEVAKDFYVNKLGFSVISQVEPDILIIDEVLAVGDISFQAKCIQTIRDFKNKGVTILFVSHNMSDVEKICDRVVWIENHKLREIGSAERIIELYKQAMA